MPLKITGNNLYFKSGIDNKQLKKDAKAGSKEIDKMTGKVKKSGDRMAAGLKKAFKFIIGAVIVKKILDIGKALYKAGSDAEEIRSKFEVTFQSINAEADKVAISLSRGYGLARVKAEELLSTTGDLLTGFGFTRKEALDTSDAVQKLAVDLASFNNLAGGTAQASHIITKALLGERETLTTLGVKIMDMDLQQELLNRGMSKLTGTALLQAKALITLDMIAIQSKNAIGDFARTSQSAANQGRILTENIKDLTVNLGKKFSPAVGKTFVDMNKLVRSMVEMTEVKMSDTFKDEQVALNTLVLQITSANISQEDRMKLINKLQEEYPFFLANIDKEKVTNEQLALKLQAVNQAYIDKIIVQKQNEKLESAASLIAKRKTKAAETEVYLISKIAEMGILLGVTQDLIGKSYKDQIDILDEANKHRKGEVDVLGSVTTMVVHLKNKEVELVRVNEKVKDAEEELNEVRKIKLEILKALNIEEDKLFSRTKIEEKKEEVPATPETKVPELTRIEAVTELNGLLKKQTELEDEIGKQQLKNRSKLKPFLASIKGLYGDLQTATIKEGKARLKMVDAMIKAEIKAGRTIEGLVNERTEIIDTMTKNVYAIQDVMYGVSDVIGVVNADIGQLIGSATQLIASLATGDVGGIFGGIVGVFKTLISLFEQEAEVGQTAQEKMEEYYEKLNTTIDAVNNSLRLQIKLLTEINGTEWLSGAVQSIVDIQKEMDNMAERMPTWGLGFMAPLETTEAKMERWRKMLSEFRTTGEHEAIFAYEETEEMISNLLDAYDAQKELLEDLLDTYHEELTGTTTASIADSITQGFSEGLDSAEVFADTFEDLMRNALIEALKRSLYDKGLEQFYENFYKAVESGGGLDEAEIERLREEYNQILANAEAAWSSMSDLLGDEFALPGEEDPLVGAIRGLSEETAGVLAGQMMAIRINVAEGLEVAENSFLQLVEIADNTSYNHYLEQIASLLQQNSEQALLRSGG